MCAEEGLPINAHQAGVEKKYTVCFCLLPSAYGGAFTTRRRPTKSVEHEILSALLGTGDEESETEVRALEHTISKA